jgi:hypothetical protein
MPFTLRKSLWILPFPISLQSHYLLMLMYDRSYNKTKFIRNQISAASWVRTLSCPLKKRISLLIIIVNSCPLRLLNKITSYLFWKYLIEMCHFLLHNAVYDCKQPTMDFTIKIPYGKRDIKLFLSDIPSWLIIWIIVIIVLLRLLFGTGLLNL